MNVKIVFGLFFVIGTIVLVILAATGKLGGGADPPTPPDPPGRDTTGGDTTGGDTTGGDTTDGNTTGGNTTGGNSGNVSPSPVDCQLSDWSAYDTCSKKNGQFTHTRSRTIITQPKNGGAPCGKLTESEPCQPKGCKITDIISTTGITDPKNQLNNWCYDKYNQDNNYKINHDQHCTAFTNDTSTRGVYTCNNGNLVKESIPPGCAITNLISITDITDPKSQLNNWCYTQYNQDNNYQLKDGQHCVIFPGDSSKQATYMCSNGNYVKQT